MEKFNLGKEFKKALGIGVGVTMIGSSVSAEGNLNNNVSLENKENKEISFEENQSKDNETYQLKQEDLQEGLNLVDGLNFESLDSIPDAKANYGYKQLGTKKLVGKQRPYFGSEFTGEKGPFFKQRTSKDPIQYIGNIYPDIGMDGKAIFYDFGPDGKGHIVELNGDDEVFRDENGKLYAVVCGNLLKFITTGQENSAPKKEKVVKEEVYQEKVIQQERRQPVVEQQKISYVTWQLIEKVSYPNWNTENLVGDPIRLPLGTPPPPVYNANFTWKAVPNYY